MEGEYLVCPNTAGCPAQAVGRIKRYIAGLDIKDWGDVLIEKLVSSRKVGTPSDLYHLDTFLLSEMDRISEPLAAKLLALLWEKAEQPLEVLLGSLSIPLCSNSTIRAVLDAGIDTWEKLQVASIGELQQVPGVGPAKAEALVLWLIQGRKIVDDLLAAGVRLQNRTYGVLTGVSICFTGKSVMKRADLEALVSKHGGTVKTSVGRGLTYLVMADPASGSSKAKAAVKNGTQCITEEALLKMVQPV